VIGEIIMRKNKLLKLIIVGCITVIALTACGGKNESSEENTSTTEEAKEVSINIKEFAQNYAGSRTDVSLVEMTEDYVKGMLSFDVTKVSEYTVYVDASGTTVDEFGVFKANEGEGEEVAKLLETYLDMRLDTWMDEYMPEQKPNVENAVVKNIGDYYIYMILSDSERETFVSNFEEAAK